MSIGRVLKTVGTCAAVGISTALAVQAVDKGLEVNGTNDLQKTLGGQMKKTDYDTFVSTLTGNPLTRQPGKFARGMQAKVDELQSAADKAEITRLQTQVEALTTCLEASKVGVQTTAKTTATTLKNAAKSRVVQKVVDAAKAVKR